MERIYGTLADHEELVKWARSHNEKVLEFICDMNGNIAEDDMRVVFKAPWNIYNWMRYNCYVNCMQNHFREKYGENYLET